MDNARRPRAERPCLDQRGPSQHHRDGVANKVRASAPLDQSSFRLAPPSGTSPSSDAPAATKFKDVAPSSRAPQWTAASPTHSFSASRPVIQSLGKGSTFMELPASDFMGDHPIPLPPLAEQRAIAECLGPPHRRDRRIMRPSGDGHRAPAGVSDCTGHRCGDGQD